MALHLPRLSGLSYQFLSHSWMLQCRQTHLATSFTKCPRRRFRLMRQASSRYPYLIFGCFRADDPSALSPRRWAFCLAYLFSIDAFVQTIGCVFSNDPLDSQNLRHQSVQDNCGDLSSLICAVVRLNLIVLTSSKLTLVLMQLTAISLWPPKRDASTDHFQRLDCV